MIKKNQTEVIYLYKYTNNRFSSSVAFQIISYVNNFIRDVLSVVTEIVLNIILAIQIRKFFQKKIDAGMTTAQARRTFRRSERNNTKLAVVMCFCSILSHLLSFATFLFLKYGYRNPGVLYIGVISFLVNSMRHTANFFFFYALNKKFKRKIYFRISFRWNTISAITDSNTQNNSNSNIQLEYIHKNDYITKLWSQYFMKKKSTSVMLM